MIESTDPALSKPVIPGQPGWPTGGIAPEEGRGLPLSEVRRRIVAVAERHRLTGETLDVAIVRLLGVHRDGCSTPVENDSFLLVGEYQFRFLMAGPFATGQVGPKATFERLLCEVLRNFNKRVDELFGTDAFETREHACTVAFYTEGNLVDGWMKDIPRSCKEVADE